MRKLQLNIPCRLICTTTIMLFACQTTGTPVSAGTASKPEQMKTVLLPGGPARVSMDYLAYEPANSRVWVPAGNTGKVDIIDASTFAVQSIEGFPTKQQEKRVLGPSSVTVGDGYAYVGNRANNEVCAIDLKMLKTAGCATLSSMPDGIAYVATTREVWVTTPRDSSLTVLDVKSPGSPAVKQVLPLEGEPEGYAVDAVKGRFYTNLENKDATLVFDVVSHSIVSKWNPECGSEGPRGLVLDAERQILVVACVDHLVSLNAARNGQRLSSIPTGNGVDNIDYAPALHAVYAAAGRSSNMTIARLSAQGEFTSIATLATSSGARVVVVNKAGTAFVADSAGGRILVSHPPSTP